MSDDELKRIETELDNDDHHCDWVDGNAHSHPIGLAYELLEEIHRLRKEVNELEESDWYDIGTSSGPGPGEFIPRYKED